MRYGFVYLSSLLSIRRDATTVAPEKRFRFICSCNLAWCSGVNATCADPVGGHLPCRRSVEFMNNTHMYFLRDASKSEMPYSDDYVDALRSSQAQYQTTGIFQVDRRRSWQFTKPNYIL